VYLYQPQSRARGARARLVALPPTKFDPMSQYPIQQRLEDMRAIARLGGPLLANNLSITGMALADTVMAGQLGAVALGGLAVGAAYWHLFLIVAFGLLMAISPAVAHANGAGNDTAVIDYVRQSWWIGIALSCVLMLGLWQVDWVLPAVGITEDVIPTAVGYVHAISWGMPGTVAFFVLRYASEGLGRTKPVMYISATALVLNVFGNWVFMYGKFGAPALGAVGCGVASAMALWFMFIAMFIHMRRHRAYRRFDFFAKFAAPQARTLRELMRIGAPIAGSILAEGGLFGVAALMMGAMGAVIVGAHQIALNYASFMFMAPLAISSATTIHVGHTIGRGDRVRARFVGLLGVGMCAALMFISAIIIVLCNDLIAGLYTRDDAVRNLAATLLLTAALFQLSDGIQVGAAGALRGFKDTAVPMAMCVFSYWIVGFATAYYFGVYQQRGPIFVWVGLIAGLTVSAILLVARFLRISGRAQVSFKS
jgi:MATE family multidrug resistance protein